jgi:hypothetical protein
LAAGLFFGGVSASGLGSSGFAFPLLFLTAGLFFGGVSASGLGSGGFAFPLLFLTAGLFFGGVSASGLGSSGFAFTLLLLTTGDFCRNVCPEERGLGVAGIDRSRTMQQWERSIELAALHLRARFLDQAFGLQPGIQLGGDLRLQTTGFGLG